MACHISENPSKEEEWSMLANEVHIGWEEGKKTFMKTSKGPHSQLY
jgi:hypothetical protein